MMKFDLFQTKQRCKTYVQDNKHRDICMKIMEVEDQFIMTSYFTMTKQYW